MFSFPTSSNSLNVYYKEQEKIQSKTENVVQPHFTRFASGDIVVLTGTSTAGKSSIAREVKKLEPDRKEEDLDLRFDPQGTSPTSEDQIQMFDDVIDQALEGKKALVHCDQGYKFLQRIYERRVYAPVRVVMAYCPFSELSNRLQKRNEEAEKIGGDSKNYRDPLMPIDNFSEVYTHKEGDDKGLEVISRDQAIETHDKHFDDMIQHAKKVGNSLPPEEQIFLDKIESRNTLLSKLGFKERMQSVEIEPRNKEHYDHIFDTHKYSDQRGMEEIAKVIHQGTYINN